jgi:hypothetical protein
MPWLVTGFLPYRLRINSKLVHVGLLLTKWQWGVSELFSFPCHHLTSTAFLSVIRDWHNRSVWGYSMIGLGFNPHPLLLLSSLLYIVWQFCQYQRLWHQMRGDWWVMNWKDWEGSSHDLIEILTKNLSGWIEENHKLPQPSWDLN